MYAQIRKARVFYETHGEGEPVLLLHGGFGTNEDYASQIPELAKHFRAVAFERQGHGHTADSDQPFTFDIMSAYTIDFIEALKLAPVNLVGWSDGAITALYVAISRPDLVRRLVSVSGSYDTSYQSPEEIAWLQKATPESFRKMVPGLIGRYDRSSPDGPDHFPVVFKKTIRMWLNEPNIRREELAKIAIPTLVMAADHDGVTLEHTIELFRSIKNAGLCIVPGATHFLLSEKPEATTRAMIEFLQKKQNTTV
jgi:pimeloyl-ACP methyl ester carboxylesterase